MSCPIKPNRPITVFTGPDLKCYFCIGNPIAKSPTQKSTFAGVAWHCHKPRFPHKGEKYAEPCTETDWKTCPLNPQNLAHIREALPETNRAIELVRSCHTNMIGYTPKTWTGKVSSYHGEDANGEDERKER